MAPRPGRPWEGQSCYFDAKGHIKGRAAALLAERAAGAV